MTKTPKEKPKDESKLGFGHIFTDHMLIMPYTAGQGWHDPEIRPYGPIELSPASMCLHYGQTVFEGLKAYRTAEGKVQLFRPEENRVDAKGHNSFNKVFANIQLLRSKYPAYFDRLVMFNSVLHNRNGVESTYRFIKDEFGKDPAISPLNNSGIRKENTEEFYRTYQNFSESIQEATNCEALEKELFIKEPKTNMLLNHIHYQTGNVFDNYNDLLLGRTSIIYPPSGTCTPFSKKMFVTVKGRILQCERINHEFALGQITDEKVELDLEQAAQQHNEYVFRYINQCKTCAVKQMCMQCVYKIDDIHDKTSKCYSYRSTKQHEKQKEYCLDYLDKHPELYNKILKNVVVRG